MVPAAFVDDTIEELLEHLEAGDIIIDGGNSYYRDDIDRAERLRPSGIHYVDVRHERRRVRPRPRVLPDDRRRGRRRRPPRPDLPTIAPGVDAAPRTPGRTGEPSTAENGYLHCGPNGAGHFVKMVHNGIEYGIMAAYAEGLNVLQQRRRRQAAAPGRRRDHAAARPAVLPVRPRPPGGRRGVAARERRRVVAARPHRARALGATRPRRLRGPGVRHRRRSLDHPRRDRRRRPRRRARARRCTRGSRRAAAPTSPTSSSRRCARSSAATTRSSIRRSERRSESDAIALRRARVLRDVGRPRPQEDLPRALRDGEEGRRSTSR